MAEYIDLNNTEVLAEAGENAKLVVEEDGELKRIPAGAVGQVKTVNGVEPDEAGNVVVSGLPEDAAAHQQLVTDETGAAKWEARTHYVAPDGTVHPLDAKFIPETIARTADVNAAISALGSVLRFKGAVATVDLLPTEGNELGDVYYVTEGSSGYAWIQDADGTQRWEQLGPMISGEFLPTGATAYQQLVTDGEGKAKWEDKPFYEVGTSVKWDGNTEGLVNSTQYYKVSDAVPTKEQCIGGHVTLVNDGSSMSGQFTEDALQIDEENIFGCDYFCVVKEDGTQYAGETFPEKGIYFLKIGDAMYMSELKLTDYDFKPLDAKFLSKHRFEVNMTLNDRGNYPKTFDKTLEETITAVQNGMNVVGNVFMADGEPVAYRLPVVKVTDSLVAFAGFAMSDSSLCYFDVVDPSKSDEHYWRAGTVRTNPANGQFILNDGEYFQHGKLIVQSYINGINDKKFKIYVAPNGIPTITDVDDAENTWTPDYISTPSTATVGQTVVVKAVDESGKPTEWEAVDAAEISNYLVITGKAPAASATDLDYSTFEYSANLSFDYAAKLIRAGQLAGVAVNLIATFEDPESGAYEVETQPIGVVAYVLGGNANEDGIVIVTGGDVMADMYNHPYPFTSQQRFKFTRDGVQLVVPS